MDSGFTSPRNQTRVHGVRKQDTNKYLLCMQPVAAIAGFLVRLLHNTQPIDHFRRKLKVMEDESLFVHERLRRSPFLWGSTFSSCPLCLFQHGDEESVYCLVPLLAVLSLEEQDLHLARSWSVFQTAKCLKDFAPNFSRPPILLN
jgi:hypothetical protein